MHNILWILPAPLSRTWSFSHQIRLASRTLKQNGSNIIFIQAASTLAQIKSILNRRPISFIMIHGYPQMFPVLFESESISKPIFLWAQVSGLALARDYNRITIKNVYLIPVTPLSKHFFEAGGFPRVTQVIPHMVDVKTFYPLSRKYRMKLKAYFGVKDKFVFGAAGVNCNRKRLKDLIYIYADIRPKVKYSAFVLKTKKISLEGDDLEKFVKGLGLEKDVIFIEDYLTPGRLNQIYNIFDLYCHISEWEGFGLTVAEAMAAGIPVLAHNTQGPGEYLPCKKFLVPSIRAEKVGDTEVGLVDKEEFKKKMIFAYEEREALRDCAEQGYSYVHKNFSPQLIANKFLQLDIIKKAYQ